MEELDKLKEENASLKTIIQDMKDSVLRTEKELSDIHAELADDIDEVASYQAMLVIAGTGISEPIPVAEVNEDNFKVDQTRKQIIDNHIAQWRSQNKSKHL